MDSETLSQEYWEQVPHNELPHFASDEKTDAELKVLRRFLKPTDQILDLGCGWGRITYAMATSGYDVVGVDLSKNLLTYARQRSVESGMKIRFDQRSLKSIPYPDGSFDKVICLWGAYNHLPSTTEQINSMDEMFRVLQPGGMAFIEMGNGERKKYRQIMATIGYGHKNRVWNS
jgi:ubiquinone/menaquinone biosynthesis C-methylase UbiE